MYPSIACLAGMAATLVAIGSAAADPLSTLISSAGGGVCFERVYHQAHLNRITGQDTQKVLLSLTSDTTIGSATMRIVLDGKKRTSVIAGECSWKARANLDVQDKPLLDSFRGGPA